MPHEPEYGVPDEENPEWTGETFAQAKRFHELPGELQRILSPEIAQAAPTQDKLPISIRLSADVITALQRRGPQWEMLADEVLREAFVGRR